MKGVLSLMSVAVLCAGGYLLANTDAPGTKESHVWEYKVMGVAELAGVEEGLTLKELTNVEAKRKREAKAMTTLNALGEQGWRLVQVEADYFYFERPKR